MDYIFCTFNTDMYYETMIDLIRPRGHIATIVAFNEKQDLNLLKSKVFHFLMSLCLRDLFIKLEI